MVLNSGVVMRVAHVSARLCQYIACNPERLSSDAVLGLIFCLPFQRFIFSLSSYLGKYKSVLILCCAEPSIFYSLNKTFAS
ncbi:hypothetical protein P8452_65778 [Trifolium repens]|nr:hypothetical protein P8452_65778 [Trifolium repens]